METFCLGAKEINYYGVNWYIEKQRLWASYHSIHTMVHRSTSGIPMSFEDPEIMDIVYDQTGNIKAYSYDNF
jgi:hypothetical protein